jgi:hypothetical protein
VDEENEGISKVEKADDDQDASRDQVRQEQFNRFAMAMALDDDGMAEQVMQELGYDCVFKISKANLGPDFMCSHAIHHSGRPFKYTLSVGYL